MNNATLTNEDHIQAIILAESTKLMAQSLREKFLDHGLKANDETAEHSLYAGLNLIAHAANTLSNYAEQCQNELNQAAQKPGKGASHE